MSQKSTPLEYGNRYTSIIQKHSYIPSISRLTESHGISSVFTELFREIPWALSLGAVGLRAIFWKIWHTARNGGRVVVSLPPSGRASPSLPPRSLRSLLCSAGPLDAREACLWLCQPSDTYAITPRQIDKGKVHSLRSPLSICLYVINALVPTVDTPPGH